MAERDRAQFPTPENLAKSIASETGELLECFHWGADAQTDAFAENWPTCSPTAFCWLTGALQAYLREFLPSNGPVADIDIAQICRPPRSS